MLLDDDDDDDVAHSDDCGCTVLAVKQSQLLPCNGANTSE